MAIFFIQNKISVCLLLYIKYSIILTLTYNVLFLTQIYHKCVMWYIFYWRSSLLYKNCIFGLIQKYPIFLKFDKWYILMSHTLATIHLSVAINSFLLILLEFFFCIMVEFPVMRFKEVFDISYRFNSLF